MYPDHHSKLMHKLKARTPQVTGTTNKRKNYLKQNSTSGLISLPSFNFNFSLPFFNSPQHELQLSYP